LADETLRPVEISCWVDCRELTVAFMFWSATIAL
jgi:hypothetical protein